MLQVKSKRNKRRAPIFQSAGRRWPLYVLCLAAAGLLAAGGLVVYTSLPADNNSNQVIMSVGRGFVRDVVREDWKTRFSDNDETRVEPLPGHKFLVAGWVDVIGEEGLSERHTFSCVVYKNESDDWVGEKVAVIPQQL